MSDFPNENVDDENLPLLRIQTDLQQSYHHFNCDHILSYYENLEETRAYDQVDQLVQNSSGSSLHLGLNNEEDDETLKNVNVREVNKDILRGGTMLFNFCILITLI